MEIPTMRMVANQIARYYQAGAAKTYQVNVQKFVETVYERVMRHVMI